MLRLFRVIHGKLHYTKLVIPMHFTILMNSLMTFVFLPSNLNFPNIPSGNPVIGNGPCRHRGYVLLIDFLSHPPPDILPIHDV